MNYYRQIPEPSLPCPPCPPGPGASDSEKLRYREASDLHRASVDCILATRARDKAARQFDRAVIFAYVAMLFGAGVFGATIAGGF